MPPCWHATRQEATAPDYHAPASSQLQRASIDFLDTCIEKFREESAKRELPPAVASQYLRACSLMGLADADKLMPVLTHVGHVAGRMEHEDVVVLMEVSTC